MWRKQRLWASAACLVIVSAAVDAQAQSITYRYDEFGRLIGSTFSGGVNNGRQTATCFDAVGNRMRYDATAAVPAACGAGLSITPSAQGLEGAATFAVRKIGSTASVVTVSYATVNGTAVAGSDYTAATGTLTFNPTDTVATLTVALLPDNLPEGVETFTVVLSNPSGASILNSTGMTSIAENIDTWFSPITAVSGQYLLSKDGRFKLIMQSDGDLVLLFGSDKIWSSQTAGNPGAYATFQADGNLIVYKANGAMAWATNTAGNTNARLVVQSDGNLVIYRSNGTAAWASNTCCR